VKVLPQKKTTAFPREGGERHVTATVVPKKPGGNCNWRTKKQEKRFIKGRAPMILEEIGARMEKRLNPAVGTTGGKRQKKTDQNGRGREKRETNNRGLKKKGKMGFARASVERRPGTGPVGHLRKE